MSERGGAVWSGEPSCPPEIRSTATLRKVVSLSLSLFLLLSFFFAPSTYVIYTVRAYSHASDPPKTISLPELVVSQVPLSTEANLLGCRLACSNAPRPAPRIDGLLTRR